MGKYKFNRQNAGLDRIIDEREARETILKAESSQKNLGVIVAILWLFGCRVNEVLRLRAVDIHSDTTRLIVSMPYSKKRRKFFACQTCGAQRKTRTGVIKHNFESHDGQVQPLSVKESFRDIPPHILKVPITAPFVQEWILPYVEGKEPNEFLFTCKRGWVGKWIAKANPLVSPHWFRKSRLSQLALAEATDSQLTAWAGWGSSQAAKAYIEYGGALASQLSDRVK